MTLRTVGGTIRDARRQAGLSLSELARRINVPKTTLSAWERGINKLDRDDPAHQEAVDAIARELGLHPAVIWQATTWLVRDLPDVNLIDVERPPGSFLTHKETVGVALMVIGKSMNELVMNGDFMSFEHRIDLADEVMGGIHMLLAVMQEQVLAAQAARHPPSSDTNQRDPNVKVGAPPEGAWHYDVFGDPPKEQWERHKERMRAIREAKKAGQRADINRDTPDQER